MSNTKEFTSKDPLEVEENVFDELGNQWMLISVGDKKKTNAMTASWGAMGVLWQKNIAVIFVRKSRYTYELLEKNDYFSLCFFNEEQRDILDYCSSHSGKDVDKLSKAGLTAIYDNKAPYFSQCRKAIVCKKVYSQDLQPENFYADNIFQNYPDEDYHRVYVGEIVDILETK